MRPESALQRAVCDYLEALGLFPIASANGAHLAGDKLTRARKWNAMRADRMRPGFPDLTVLGTNGRVGFMEVKTPKGQVQDSQRRMIEQLGVLGHQTAIVRSVDDTREALKIWGWIG